MACLGAVAAGPASAQNRVVVGFVDLVDDPRYDEDYAYNMVAVRPLGRAVDGAQLGVDDAAQIGQIIGADFFLLHNMGEDVDALVASIQSWVAADVHFVLADLPHDALLELADRVADLPVTLFNVSALENDLRGESCRLNVIHTIPSHQMLTDALVQYLASKTWRNILVLQGPTDSDAATVEALRRSVSSFGARIVGVRPVLLSNDPRNREEGNVALATAGANYDVVFVADSDGEFARYAPFATNDPRPVVGSAGLVAQAWHWSWERSGAPQVNARFELLTGRRMDGEDWAAWAAVRTITQGVLRAQSVEYEAVRDFIFGDQLNVDGAKAFPMSVRPWNNQMRQAIALATGNAVIGLAPIAGFDHRTNDLDTLGVDEPLSSCQF